MNNEPVAWMIIDVDNGKSLQFEENKFSEINIPLYTAPRELSDEIDYEAIAWALQKLHNFGVTQNSMDNAIMADRLEAILKKASEK
jgi:hypothetical protein